MKTKNIFYICGDKPLNYYRMYKINNSEMKNLLGGNDPDNGTLAGATFYWDGKEQTGKEDTLKDDEKQEIDKME